MLRCYENLRTRILLCEHNILTEGVFVTKVSGNAWISVSTNWMGYNKLLFHERHFGKNVH